MTLADFNSQILPLINLAFSVLGVLSVILLFIQIRQTDRWNRLQSRFNFIDIADCVEANREMNLLFEKLGLYKLPKNQEFPFSADAIRKIEESGHGSTFIVDMFLNDMQNICAALRYGLVDKEVFDSIHSGRVLFWYRRLSSYVEKKRIDYDDPRLWSDFERVAQDIERERQKLAKAKNSQSKKTAWPKFGNVLRLSRASIVRAPNSGSAPDGQARR